MTAIGRLLEDARQHRKGDQNEGGEINNVELLNLILTLPSSRLCTGIRVTIM